MTDRGAPARSYDPLHPLSRGVSLIEASAGTGKTHNITHLVLRLVTERAVPLRRILVVTFTRAATAELEERIRVRLGQAAAILAGADPSALGAGGDPVLAGLRERAGDELELWRRRARAALEAFDEAFVSTIHGFCQRTLQQNAFESDADFGLELVSDPGPVLEEIVDDFLTATFYDADQAHQDFYDQACRYSREALLKLAAAATGDPEIEVLPAPGAYPLRGLTERAERLLAAHPGWVDEVVEAVEEARADGVFTARQRTYNRKKARAQAEALDRWLRDADALIGGPPPPSAHAYFFDLDSSKGMRAKLSDPDEPFSHPILAQLDAVRAYRDLAAASERARFVAHARAELDRRNAARRVQTYQDLLRSLAHKLRGEGYRQALVDAVGERFDAALIDEFQDTDNLQWDIFHALFGQGGHYLYLIGDPKQAIYGFRGANVHVYLAAKRSAGEQTFTMTRNWRSDRRYVEAMNHLMDRPGFFGEEEIEYIEVEAAPREPAERLIFEAAPAAPLGASAGSTSRAAPLQLRFLGRELAPSGGDPLAPLNKGDLARLLPRIVADDLVALLQSGARIHAPGHPAADAAGFRPVGPGDLAILVRKGRQGRATQAALQRAGVPAVFRGGGSVLASDEARWLLLWLEAVAHPARDRRARAAAITPIFGWTLDDLRALDDEEADAVRRWDRWVAAPAGWQRAIKTRGVMRTFREALAGRGGIPRLLGAPEGERHLTNLLHALELLHTAERQDRLGLASLITWLQRQRGLPSLEAEAVELRLERDDEAVTIVTTHASKGLQYPIVWAPYLWDGQLLFRGEPERLIIPQPEQRQARLMDVHIDLEAPPKPEHLALAALEAHRENLRLLYVALTRARHRCVVYGGEVTSFGTSPLAAAILGRSSPPDAEISEPLATLQGQLAALLADAEGPGLFGAFEALAQGSTGSDGAPTIAALRCGPPEDRRWAGALSAPLQLSARVFHRPDLDEPWARHSYTALTRDLHLLTDPSAPPTSAEGALDGVDPDREGFDDDASAADLPEAYAPHTPAPPLTGPPQAEPVPLAEFPAGADAGVFLHEVFERLDFRALAPAPTHPAEGAPPREGEPREGDRVPASVDAPPIDPEALPALLAELLPRHGFDVERWSAPLSAGLTPALRTPLGGPVGALRLCDIPREDRLDELRFDLPLAGGDRFGEPGHERPIEGADFAAAFGLRAGDERMRPEYISGLRGLGFRRLAGFLNGSIDLVFRHRPAPLDGDEPGPDARWYVVDYKSNRIDPEGTGAPSVHHFAAPRLRWQMEEHHYYVQYHLYSLALHRYLRWRLGERYRYDAHFGGVYYLFFRGMVGGALGAGLAPPPGVFYDRPARAVIEALDRLFDDPAARAPRSHREEIP